jgi:nickel-type superoxide dismutase maturation protease
MMSDELQDSGIWQFLLWILRLRWRFRVNGTSMLPLLKPGQEVLINPRAYKYRHPQPGDIVVAQRPDRPDVRLIKRVVSITENGRCILKGDNPLESTDSRNFGPVPMEYLVGQVTGRF